MLNINFHDILNFIRKLSASIEASKRFSFDWTDTFNRSNVGGWKWKESIEKLVYRHMLYTHTHSPSTFKTICSSSWGVYACACPCAVLCLYIFSLCSSFFFPSQLTKRARSWKTDFNCSLSQYLVHFIYMSRWKILKSMKHNCEFYSKALKSIALNVYWLWPRLISFYLRPWLQCTK